MGFTQAFIFLTFIAHLNLGAAEEVETVVVTGTRVSPSRRALQLEPASTSERPELSHLVLSLPNLSFVSGANRPRFFQIRGVGESSQFEHSQVNAVGMFYEGIDLSEEASALPLFGRETLAVAYGPQVIRWGGKALAGSLEATSCLDAGCAAQRWLGSVGSFGARALSGSTLWRQDRVSILLNAEAQASEGYIHNTYLDKRTAFQDDRNVVVGFAYPLGPVRVRQHHLLALHHDGYDNWSFSPGYTTLSDHPGRDDHQVQGHSLQWETAPGAWVLHGLSSLTLAQQLESYDEDWGNDRQWQQTPGWNQPYNYFAQFERRRSKFHQKFWLSHNSGIEFGLHHSRYHEHQVVRSYNDEVIRRISQPSFDSNATATWLKKQWRLTHGFFELGTRVETQSLRLKVADTALERTLPLSFGLDLRLHHRWNSELASEFSLLRGYRGGGYNTSPTLPRDRVAYDPEQLYLAEASNHYVTPQFSWLGRVFFQRQVRSQARSSYQQDPMDPNSFSYYTANVDGSRSFGAESTLSRSWRAWTLSGSAGLMHSQYDAYRLGSRKLTGRQVAHAPPWNYQLRLAFAPAPYSFYTQVSGRDSAYHSVDHDYKSTPSHLVDVGSAITLGRWQVQFWIKNLLAERYAVRAFYFANEPPAWQEKYYVQLGDPRSYGLQAILTLP